MNQEDPIIDMDEMAKYISLKSGFELDTVELILEEEEEYYELIGFLSEEKPDIEVVKELDLDDLIKFIQGKTDLSYELIETVMDFEHEYLDLNGIII